MWLSASRAYSPLPQGRALGINTEGLSYASLEQPWLNIIKGMGAAGAYGYDGLNGPWLTSKTGTNDTGEEAYLQLDSNGWPTSLTASPAPPGGQQFTYLQSFMFFGYSGTLPPGASQWYPYTGVTWQAQIVGSGTISFVGASSLTVTSGGANLSVSGTQLTSTLSSGQAGTVTFTSGSGGINFRLTATSAAPNNLQIPYIVNQAYLANYNAGEILSPDYKAAITGNGAGKVFSVLRTMGWQNTYNQEFLLTFTSILAQNSTSGTLSHVKRQSRSYTTWPFPTGVRKKVVFATGQVVNMTGTFGSTSVSWDVPLSGAVSTSAIGGMAILSLTAGWSERQLPSNATWSGLNGPPYEVMIQVGNELEIDPWFCVPAAVPTIDSTYLSNLANLICDGSGANISGWNVQRFSGLSSAQRVYVEFSNECWNFGSGYQEANFCEMMGVVKGFYAAQGNNGPYGGAEFYGTQAAVVGDAFYSVYGITMPSRVGVVMMNQTGVGNGTGFMKVAMNTPDWTSAAYTHHIYGIGDAPYFGPTYNSSMNSTDAGTIAALPDPVTELFSLAYTNVGASGTTYSSVPTSGYLGSQLTAISNYIAAFNGQPWAGLPFVCYEGGLDLGNYSGNSLLTTYLNAMYRDIRAQYLNYDPKHVLSASGTGYLSGLSANGVTFINLLNLTGQQWGQLEVVTQMESTPPYTNEPRYLGDLNYALGN